MIVNKNGVTVASEKSHPLRIVKHSFLTRNGGIPSCKILFLVPKHGWRCRTMSVLVSAGEDGRIHWVQCDQCDQWRETDEDFEKTRFLCCFLHPWEEPGEDGIYRGGCNASPFEFEAFDSSLLDRNEEISEMIMRQSFCDLLDKLPKNFCNTTKSEFLQSLDHSHTNDEFMHQVQRSRKDIATHVMTCSRRATYTSACDPS
jgi:hypothetical protein